MEERRESRNTCKFLCNYSFPRIFIYVFIAITTNELVRFLINDFFMLKKKCCEVTLREQSNKRERNVCWPGMCSRRDSSAHARRTGTGRSPFFPFFPQRFSADVAPSRPSCARIRAPVPSWWPLWSSKRSSNFCPNLHRRAANRRDRCSAWSSVVSSNR